MAKITIEELSDNLIASISNGTGLGLTASQVQEIVRTELSNGNLDQLQTESKDVVGAINEVFQRGNDVKQSLVEALIAKGVEASTSESFESLMNKMK